ncbi:MAG: glutathione S-transferase [Pseudomonadota bacterium]|uniref:glutathione S-transferase family protein n=1 Tax=unclassified Phenylobacterium TaxID=2640670 RepID=UPI0006F6CFF7|nr:MULTISPECIES: glutathione S-transferase [unclassified Phenylobacterium]KRB46664.1 glutathione S-transferase [Phenylobacterium sp. Root700]MBT9470404.1 glutathione S-transferase [Phenylobacterium sp.]
MKLYDTSLAPNPRRVRWFMAEKGIEDVEIVSLNLIQGAHKQPEYLAKAGLPNVPALEMDDGTTITESIAICRYLEARYPEPNLFGRTPEETAVIEMWTRRAEMMVATPFMLGVRHTHPALAALETQNPAIAEYNKEAGLRALKVLDRRLAEAEWLAAGRLTIADIVGFIGLDFTRMIKLAIPEDLKNVHRWAQAMRERPAAKAAM